MDSFELCSSLRKNQWFCSKWEAAMKGLPIQIEHMEAHIFWMNAIIFSGHLYILHWYLVTSLPFTQSVNVCAAFAEPAVWDRLPCKEIISQEKNMAASQKVWTFFCTGKQSIGWDTHTCSHVPNWGAHQGDHNHGIGCRSTTHAPQRRAPRTLRCRAAAGVFEMIDQGMSSQKTRPILTPVTTRKRKYTPKQTAKRTVRVGLQKTCQVAK